MWVSVRSEVGLHADRDCLGGRLQGLAASSACERETREGGRGVALAGGGGPDALERDGAVRLPRAQLLRTVTFRVSWSARNRPGPAAGGTACNPHVCAAAATRSGGGAHMRRERRRAVRGDTSESPTTATTWAGREHGRELEGAQLLPACWFMLCRTRCGSGSPGTVVTRPAAVTLKTLFGSDSQWTRPSESTRT